MNKKIVSVFLFGLIGGLLRYIFQLAFAEFDQIFPISLIVINILGSFLLGLLTGGLLIRLETPDYINIGLTNGLLGGFTTFSSYELMVVSLIKSQNTLILMLYLFISLSGTLLGAFYGQSLGKHLIKRFWED